MISRVKGTQDFLDLTLFNFIVDQAKKFFKLYNFTEISTPILEPVELFKRALGTHTDVVTKEMYCFGDNQEGDEHICLRPEATASTARAFVENSIEIIPWKVFSYGPMFRHERPQKGRYRQFHQFNVEVIGSASISQDVLFIKMLDHFFSKVLQLNSYAILINFLGCQEDREIFKKKLLAFLEKNIDVLCTTCRERKDKNILRTFDCKNQSCQDVYVASPKITDKLCEQCSKEWTTLQDQLALISTSFVHKPTLVRGLDYYNKTVFEFVSDNLGAQNSFCGGGRYDQLVAYSGGKVDQPSIGAAIGIERLMLLLEPLQNKLPLEQKAMLSIVIPTDTAQETLSLLIVDQLIQNKFTVDILLDGSLKSRMRKANKLGAKYCIIIGPEEQEKHQVTLKNMMSGEENKVSQTQLITFLR